MPIQSVINQPASSSINAAYRPVELTVRATANNGTPKPPVVYCDIYINSFFYKTLSKSQYTTLNATNSDWTFDIQDACQEYLRVFLATNGGNLILNAAPAACGVNCLFRSSMINSNGFIESDGSEPIQATGNSSSVAGTGTSSNVFFVINSTLQHEDNQDLAAHLNAVKTGTWGAGYYPLTHRPARYKICRNDSDYFQVIATTNALTISKLRLNYRFIGQTTYRQSVSNIVQTSGIVFYIPNGPKNLSALFPLVNLNDVDEYYIQGLDGNNAVLITSTVNELSKCCEEDKIRIHFANYLGTIDAINFMLITKEHNLKSSSWERPLKAPLDKAVHSVLRSNVKSNNVFNVLSIDYNEAQMDWIEELFDSGMAWMEWKGTQGQPDNYIPIIVTDKSIVTRKVDDRYIYEMQLEFILSHDKILIRN
ncbi:MAG: hypothetical protein WKF91_23420 [Segetibacter sp.]